MTRRVVLCGAAVVAAVSAFGMRPAEGDGLAALRREVAELKASLADHRLATTKSAEDLSHLSRTSPPVGTVAAFAGAWPPRRGDGRTWTEAELGWLACDGRKLVDGGHAELRAALGRDSVPDLRGQFLRGADDMGTERKAANVDADRGRKVGTPQGFAMQDHTHTTPGLIGAAGNVISLLPANLQARGNMFWSNSTHDARDGGTAQAETRYARTTGPLLTGTNPAATAAETRPVNVAIVWVIKFK